MSYTVYRPFTYLDRILTNILEICFVIIFSGLFPLCEFKLFLLSMSYTIQRNCFTCFRNHPFNVVNQWSWWWYGIVLNDIIIWLWTRSPTFGVTCQGFLYLMNLIKSNISPYNIYMFFFYLFISTRKVRLKWNYLHIFFLDCDLISILCKLFTV